MIYSTIKFYFTVSSVLYMIRDTFKLVYNVSAMILKLCYNVILYVQVYSIHPFKLVNMTKEGVDIPLL